MLKLIKSQKVEHLFDVLSLLKISRHLLEFKPFKMPSELVFVLIIIVFVKKSSNFNQMTIGNCMQIR